MNCLSWLFFILIIISIFSYSCFTVSLSMNLTFTTNSPSNCSAGLSYSGVILTIEHRLIDEANNPVTEWNFLEKIVMDPTDGSCTELVVLVMIPSNNNLNFIQLRVVQPEHGGGQCNCWGISKMTSISGQLYPLQYEISGEPSDIALLKCTITENFSKRCNTIFFCGGTASSPRGVVFRLVNAFGLSSNDCPDSRVIDEQNVLSPINCTMNQKLELMYEVNLDTSDAVSFEEGVEVSIGNWDKNGKWIPLVYHSTNSNGIVSHMIRGHIVPVHMKSGIFNVTVCGQSIKNGFQIRWLQDIRIFNASDAMSKIATLDAIRANLYINQTKISLLPENDCFYNLRNAMVSPSCPGTQINKLVLGLTCTTLGCEQKYNNQTTTCISRWATTMPFNVSEFLNSSDLTGQSTYSKIEYIGSVQPACNVTTFPQEPALRELISTIINVTKIINESEHLMSIKEEPPVAAVTALSEFVTDKPATVVVYLLADILNRFNGEDYRLLYETSLIISNMLINQQSISIKNKISVLVGSSLLAAVERLALYNVLYPVERQTDTENIVIVILEVFRNTEQTYFTSIHKGDNSILVPYELINIVTNGTGPITVVSVYYRNMSGLLPGTLPGETDTILASPVLSTSLVCGNNICDTTNASLTQPVIVTLSHSLVLQSLAQNTIGICVFWEFVSTKNDNRLLSGNWRTDGCTRNNSLSNSTHTVCECTHLTNFAILLSPKPIFIDKKNSQALKWLGYVGVSLSIVAMLCTIGTLGCLRSLWSMRSFVHINLCISLILAQLTFVIGINQHGGGNVVLPSCQTAAVLIQYLFLVSFMWMLMEGVVLYIILVKVFVEHKKRYLAGFMVTSYGAPLLYMALCVPLSFFLYPEANGEHGYVQVTNTTSEGNITTEVTVVCWLNASTNFVLTFIVPVVLIILINIGFFIMAITIIRKHAKRQSHKNLIQKARHWLKSSVSLATIMGITWIVGVLVIQIRALLPLSYIFTVFVAFQGVAIFINFVLIPKQVREAYLKWWRSKVAESDLLNNLFGNVQLEGNKVQQQTRSTPATQEQKQKPNPDSKKHTPTLITVLHNRSVVVENTPNTNATTPVES